jgi:hypothetical protein
LSRESPTIASGCGLARAGRGGANGGALLGMAGYAFMTLFVKLAERSSEVSTYMVMAVSATTLSSLSLSSRSGANSNRFCSSWSARCGRLRPALR